MSEKEIPTEFLKSMKDFLIDILRVFPECKETLTKGEIYILQDIDDDEEIGKVFFHCCEVYPSKFFDILYKNEEIFSKEGSVFLTPSIDMKVLWKEEISDTTKEHIWKYLQLILFSVLTTIKEPGSFGSTAKLFEAINEDELKTKLEETLGEMNDLFDLSNVNFDDIKQDLSKNMKEEDIPDVDDIHKHISGLLQGKLGRLAAEIAEDTANDLNLDMNEDTDNMGDVFEKLFKNPGKLMGMVKKVGSKLDEKLKSGELKESELMQEAADLMEKMKSMPGMKNMNSILSNMGLPIGKNNSKVNMNAFQSHMNRNVKMSSQKERMLRKLEERRLQREIEQKQKEFVHSTYKGDGVMQKSSRNPDEQEQTVKKKKKKKRRKNKKKQ